MLTNTLLDTAAEIGPSIAANVKDEETQRKLSDKTIKILGENGFLKLYLPHSLGGLEADPITTAKLIEAVSMYNPGAGWSMMVANISAWWCSMLPEDGAREIFSGSDELPMAGAFHPPMRAHRVEGGYIINGRTPLASNVSRAKWIFVTAFVMDGDQMKIQNGIPEIVGVTMKCKECEIVDTWHTHGMCATDSNDISAKDVFVPDHLQHPLVPGLPHNELYSGILYNFPAIGASVASLIAPVALATAQCAIDEYKILASKKVPFASMVPIREKGSMQRKLGEAEGLVRSSRAYLYDTLSNCWEKVIAGKNISLEEKAGILLAATHTNQSCAKAVDLIYSAVGSSGIYSGSKIGYYSANSMVIRQHGFANESRYETSAQVLLGLQPDLPVLIF